MTLFKYIDSLSEIKVMRMEEPREIPLHLHGRDHMKSHMIDIKIPLKFQEVDALYLMW